MSWKPRRWAPRYAVLGSVAVEVVMLDLALPDSTGIGTLTRMLARTQSLPIVVLTATAQRYEEHVAVGFMNIDGFKDINDRFSSYRSGSKDTRSTCR